MVTFRWFSFRIACLECKDLLYSSGSLSLSDLLFFLSILVRFPLLGFFCVYLFFFLHLFVNVLNMNSSYLFR